MPILIPQLVLGFSLFHPFVAAVVRQAQVVIEIGRAAKASSAESLVPIVAMTILFLAVVGVVIHFSMLIQKQFRKRTTHRTCRPVVQAGRLPDRSSLLPALLTISLAELMQQDAIRETDQLLQQGGEQGQAMLEETASFMDPGWPT